MNGAKSLGMFVAVALAAATLLVIPAPAPARAQSASGGPQPQVIISWKVIGGSAPSSYEGKVLPVQGASMEATVAVLDNGKFDSLSGTDVYWYLDDNFLGGGMGAQSATFSAPEHNETMSLQVELPDYKGGLTNTAYIAMVDPQVAVVAPYPSGIFSTPSVALQAVPYYFNPADLSKLSFNWTVNGNAVITNENPQFLNVNLSSGAPRGYSLLVGLSVLESGNPYLQIGKNITLTSAGTAASR